MFAIGAFGFGIDLDGGLVYCMEFRFFLPNLTYMHGAKLHNL